MTKEEKLQFFSHQHVSKCSTCLGCSPISGVDNADYGYNTEILDDNTYTPGTVATITCNDGYFFNDDRTITEKTRTCEQYNGFNDVDSLGFCTNS